MRPTTHIHFGMHALTARSTGRPSCADARASPLRRGCSISVASISSPTIEDYLDTRPDRCFLRRSAPSGRVPTRLTYLLVGAER